MRTGTLALVLTVLAVTPVLAEEACLQETYRPQYHFSPRKHWINDPNGLLYHNGVWNMYFQYSPSASVPNGDISWGHAVSDDLIHWQELDVAIEASNDTEIFSGSAVCDTNNTAGFGAGAIVAIYTCYNKTSLIQSQCIAYSLDEGVTFTKYSGNPVLDLNMTEFRDPSVQWYSSGNHWLMAVSLASELKIRFYKSSNLTTWTELGEFGGSYNSSGLQYECPDLFELTLENGTETETKHVLIVNVNPGAPEGGSAAQYFIGTFDGTNFTADDNLTRWLDYGKDNYAAITWKNAPDGNVYLIGWMSNWQYSEETPTTIWRNAMTLPRRLTLTIVDDEVVIKQYPVPNVFELKKSGSTASSLARVPRASDGQSLTLVDESLDVSSLLHTGRSPRAVEGIRALTGKAFYLSFRLSDPTGAKSQGVKVHVGNDQYTEIVYNAETKNVTVNRTESGNVSFSSDFPGNHGGPVRLINETLYLDIFVDWSSVEVFVNHGELAITETIFPDSSSNGIELFVKEGRAEFDDFTLIALSSYRDCN